MQSSVVDERYIRLTEGLCRLQEELAKTLRAPVAQSLSLKEGVLILDEPPVIPADEYRRVFLAILEYLIENQEENREELRSYANLVSGPCSGCLDPLIQAALEVNGGYFVKLGKIRQENPNLLHFVAEAAIRPFLREIAGRVIPEKDQVLEQNSCPICGEEVRLARIVAEGQRDAVCPRCSFQWRVRRLSCLCCGNDNHEQHSYLEVEKNKTAKLHLCENCKGYVKEVDTRSTPMASKEPAVIDLETLHLDILAQDKGYGPSSQQH